MLLLMLGLCSAALIVVTTTRKLSAGAALTLPTGARPLSTSSTGETPRVSPHYLLSASHEPEWKRFLNFIHTEPRSSAPHSVHSDTSTGLKLPAGRNETMATNKTKIGKTPPPIPVDVSEVLEIIEDKGEPTRVETAITYVAFTQTLDVPGFGLQRRVSSTGIVPHGAIGHMQPIPAPPMFLEPGGVRINGYVFPFSVIACYRRE